MDPLAGQQNLDRELLERFDFDEERFKAASAALAKGEISKEAAVLKADIQPVDDVVSLDWESDDDQRRAGESALAEGRVAVVVLNGGMATRFGGVVKGTVEVANGKSFIELKAEDVRRASEHFGAKIPFVLMNSFATDEKTQDHLREHDNFGLDDNQILSFTQTISLRMNPDGTLFVGDDGKPSLHAPGHGDFFPCIRRSGVLETLRSRGVEVILFSNVDNLGATIDPTIVGHHVLGEADMSVEVTAKRKTASGAWDKGGAPAKVDGVKQLVEGFRLPPDLPPTFLPDFSTNTFVFSAAAIDRDIELPRHVVEKKVDDRPAIQMESIACEVSAVQDGGKPLLNLQVLRVPRDGPNGRFYPIKEREDLDASRGILMERLESGWKARDGV